VTPLNWLFAFEGRQGRGSFWGGIFVVLVLGVVDSFTDGLPKFVLGLATLWIFWATVTKRAHDRGHGMGLCLFALLPFVIGWLWFVLPFALFGGFGSGLLGAIAGFSVGGLIFAVWAALGGLWFVIDLGLLRGQRGTNRFGVWPKRLF